jgi:hypothetical protein
LSWYPHWISKCFLIFIFNKLIRVCSPHTNLKFKYVKL